MLTLRELKKMIQTPEKNEKIPTDKLLKERKIPVVASKKIGNGERMALVAVYQNGYAMYQTAGRVFSSNRSCSSGLCMRCIRQQEG